MSAATKLENPHERPAPSERDRDIYLLHKAHRVKQKQLAHDYEMSAGRVSQIVKKVGAWFANASAKDGELDHDQQRRLERRIERERLEQLYDYNLRMLEDFEKPATSTRGEGEDAMTTKREERNARVQALKTAVRTAESLGKIAEREPLPEPPVPGMNGFVRLDLLLEELNPAADRGGGAGEGADQRRCVLGDLVPDADVGRGPGQAAGPRQPAAGGPGEDRGDAGRGGSGGSRRVGPGHRGRRPTTSG